MHCEPSAIPQWKPRLRSARAEPMVPARTSSPREKLEDWLRYYEDLNLTSFYTDRAGTLPFQEQAPGQPLDQPRIPAPVEIAQQSSTQMESFSGPKRAGITPPAPALPILNEPSLFDAADRVENDTLTRIREDLGDCTRCRLHKQRTNIVFGVGNPRAELVFVGEGPGHDEDVQGIPFVGRAGKLLTQMIEAMGLERDDVYICNVVKCRPPENRTPQDDEVATCSPYLYRQLK